MMNNTPTKGWVYMSSAESPCMVDTMVEQLTNGQNSKSSLPSPIIIWATADDNDRMTPRLCALKKH